MISQFYTCTLNCDVCGKMSVCLLKFLGVFLLTLVNGLVTMLLKHAIFAIPFNVDKT